MDITYLPACETEDSTNCYWDATVQGNGLGQSFVDINGTAHYVTVPENHYILDAALSPAPQGFSIAYQEYPAAIDAVDGYDPTAVILLAAAGIIASFIILATAFVKPAR